MSYGLMDETGNILTPQNIDCKAEVTEDFGLFTLMHNYVCDFDKLTQVKFVFPVTDTMQIMSFEAFVNERHVFSKIIPKPPVAESGTYFKNNILSGLEVPIGEIVNGDNIKIEIKYVRKLDSDAERTRLIIPTGIAPRFMYFGSQVALESLFEEIEYNISLSVMYRNHNIKNVVSPTHEIDSIYGENSVEIMLKNPTQTDKDIIIDIFSGETENAKFVKYGDYISCSFVPELDVYIETPRNYMFLIDVSNNLNSKKIQQVKNVLHLCIRALKDGDKFNLGFTQSENTFFSDEYQPLNDDTLRAASKWINAYEHQGVPEFYRPMLNIYKMSEEATVIFISDGRIAGNASIIKYAKENTGVRFYNFGFDMAVNQEFLPELSSVTNGKTRMIGHTERIDDTIVKAFNVIVSPSIDDAVVRFDSSVSMITPQYFNKIHCGERINVMFKYVDIPPQTLFIKGMVGGKETVTAVNIEQVIDGGPEMEHKFGYESIHNLHRDMYHADDKDKFILRQKIMEKSIQYSIHSKFTMLSIADESGLYNYECDVDKVNEHSTGWYEPSLNVKEKSLSHTIKEIQFTEIAKKQRSNGRFIPSNSRSREAIALNTAKILFDFCVNCENVFMYRWHLRKSVLYLLDYIENADVAEIQNEVLEALSIWNKIFGGKDEASQKIEVLKYINGYR